MKSEETIPTNKDVLIWARQTLALNKTRASEISKLSLTRLNQLESGEKNPTLNELKSLAKTYKRTLATLLLNEVPSEKPLPKDRRTLNSSQIGVFHEKTILSVRKARVLTQSYIELNNELGITIPKFTLNSKINDSAIIVSEKFRKLLNLDETNEIEDNNFILELYIEKIQKLGIAVFQLSLTQDNLRGFSILDEEIPVIVIKRGEKTTSKIFTLFHELGHIIIGQDGLCDISFDSYNTLEKWCNAFAANLLVPTNKLMELQIVKDYSLKNKKDWEKKDLEFIAKKFNVGILAILRRILDNNLTTREFYQKKHLLWNKPSFGRNRKGLGRNIPKETISEKSRNYVNLAFKAFDKNKIDLKDLTDFLGVKLSNVSKTRELLKYY